MEDSAHVDLNTNEFNLIDFSSETENLIFSASPIAHQHNFRECQGDSTIFDRVGDMDSGNVSRGNNQLEQVPELAQSEEPQRINSGRCNLRKSLAWDDAFFTSAGVLDPEELTSMMDGRKAQKQFLPAIQEDMKRSTDSISTLESENFSLESFEVELFEDIRASIQKSSTTAKASFSKTEIRKGGYQDIPSPNGGSVSQNQLKIKPVVKKVTGVQKIGAPKFQPKVNTVIQGSIKASTCSVIPRCAVTNRESTSSLGKPPKGISKPNSTTASGTKATSLGSSRLKTENTNAKSVAVRGSHGAKMSSCDSPCRVLPNSGTTSKSSSRETSMAKTRSTRFSSKGPRCDSQLSEDINKTPLATLRRKAPSKAVNSPSPLATPQSSSKIALKHKATSENSALAAYLMSSKVLSSISPASSVSELSSLSSSSSAVKQKSTKSRSSFGSSSCRSVDGDALQLNIDAHANNQIRRRQEIKRSAEILKNPALEVGVTPASTSMNPTGLKMPSPKIGFFDGVKSVRASSGSMQPRANLPVALPNVRPGVSPRGTSNIKHKVGKLPPGRVLTSRKHEMKNTDAPLPAQGKSEVTPRNGDHEKKMSESRVNVQGNRSGAHDEVSPEDDFGITNNEMMLGVDQDFCLKDVKLADPEHESKTNSCQPTTNESRSVDVLKVDCHRDLGSSFYSCYIR